MCKNECHPQILRGIVIPPGAVVTWVGEIDLKEVGTPDTVVVMALLYHGEEGGPLFHSYIVEWIEEAAMQTEEEEAIEVVLWCLVKVAGRRWGNITFFLPAIERLSRYVYPAK